MKFAFHVSPNLQSPNSTQKIMRELTIGLLVVFAASDIYYFVQYGAGVGLQALLLLACSLITTFVCEAIFAKVKKKDIKSFLSHSFGWVTSIILVMMCPITITPYAVIIATVFAIVFGRLVFGGFGYNIYNPAAVGRAVIFASFSGATTRIISGATPTAQLSSLFNWLPGTETALDAYLNTVGGWGGLAMGFYPGAIGETMSVLILLVGAYLIWRNVIDWRVPVFYLGTIFVMGMVIAALTGIEAWHGIPAILWYPLLQVLAGGVIFGAVFMLTDPVTMPTVPSGRIFYAICAAAITVLIRVKGNLPEGCMYSILIMNTFTPMIELALDAPQLKQMKKAWTMIACAAVFALCVAFYGSTNKPQRAVPEELKSAYVMETAAHHTVSALDKEAL